MAFDTLSGMFLAFSCYEMSASLLKTASFITDPCGPNSKRFWYEGVKTIQFSRTADQD